MTATLHIQHPVRDFEAWKAIFDGFHDFRVEHEVRSYRVSRGVEDDSNVAIDLVFDSAPLAASFHRLLVERVWPRQQASDVLAGAPSAVVMTVVQEEANSR